MTNDYRENYLDARNIIAQSLKAKYKLHETYQDRDRLTLSNKKHSIHLTFYTPEGENISISDLNADPSNGHSFMYFVTQVYSERENMIAFLKRLFSDVSTSDYSVDAIKKRLEKKTEFLEKNFSGYFETN
ncbi:hypothetical protein K6119_15700 [Paracrocinitomix mangrovi]|uniref:hypothetical protein n=1 Tax=Paracrocinitomix mangrovi TaxID=2862509 RepID=UPI001C8EF237|nr:hypothetical protein [Paracrocinitomix mangrovi]UKN01174.1 hypothetical protein K6119_15700 [Paracrocinitomix mangrovi]